MSCDEGNLKPNKDWCEKVDATNNHNKGSMKYNDDSNSVPCHNSTSDAAIPVKSQSCTKRQWSLLEKILLLLLILACILILCLVTALLLQPTAQATGNWEEVEICDNDGCRKEFVEVCTTAGCVMASSDLQQAIDISVNPCDDFYSYACGQWNTVHLIPEDESSYGTFRMVRDKLRMQLRGLLEEDYDETQTPKSIQMAHIAYHSCMNETNIQDFGVTPLWNKMQTLGDWPMLSRTPWRPQRLDITELLANSKAMFGSDAFIYPYVYADGKDTTHHILHIDQGALGLQAREFYLNQTYFKKQITAYKDHAKATIKLFAKDLRLRYDAATERDIQKIIEFEVTLANLTTPEDKRRNHTGRYTKWSLEKLQQRVPEIDWTRYFEIILPPEVFEILNESTPIVVQEPKYLADMTKLVTHLDSNIVQNYIHWRILKIWSKLFDHRYEDITQDFLKTMVGRQRKPPRWKVCVMTAVTWFDMAVGSSYVKEYFDSEDMEEAQEMIRNLQSSFERIVMDLDWMDEKTKNTAVEKAEAMKLHIGYPKIVKNMTELNIFYKDISITKKDSYFTIARKVAAWIHKRDFDNLLKKFDRNKFDITPAIVNAFYSPEKNAITFPAGILQPPFFRGDYPKSVNYGAMGAVIGHEITHGFDDEGSQYDKYGNLENWWSQTSYDGFYNRTQCMVKQYSSYVVPGINQAVNGNLTQGENIADNGGIKQAYRAYTSYIKRLGKEEPRLPGLAHLTNQQIFFLSFANFWCGHKKREASLQQVLTDNHSPETFRVIGVMSNSKHFANAFNCKLGSPMNPPKSDNTKCDVW